VIGRGADQGSIYAATPITVDQPVWRADILEAVDGRPFDRTHHHPVFTGWNPSSRVFARELSADPLSWLGAKLENLDGLLAEAQFEPETAGPTDAAEMKRAAPEIVDATRRLLDRVRAGELGNPPEPDAPIVVDGRQVLVRTGWL
jgi:hypothetical protein